MDLSIFEVGGHVPFPGLVASPAVVYSEAKVFIKLVNGFKFDYKVRTSLNLLVSFFPNFYRFPKEYIVCYRVYILK